MDDAVRRGLYSWDGHLGDDEPHFVRETGVLFQRPVVHDVEPARVAAHLRSDPRVSGPMRYLRVLQNVDLPVLAPRRRFLEVWVELWFEVPDARSLELVPGHESVDVPVAWAVDTTPLPGWPAQPPPGTSRPSTEPRPTVTASGVGGAGVRWLFRAQPGAPIREGHMPLGVLLEVPADTVALPMLLDCTVALGHTALGGEQEVWADLRGRYQAFRPRLAA